MQYIINKQWLELTVVGISAEGLALGPIGITYIANNNGTLLTEDVTKYINTRDFFAAKQKVLLRLFVCPGCSNTCGADGSLPSLKSGGGTKPGGGGGGGGGAD